MICHYIRQEFSDEQFLEYTIEIPLTVVVHTISMHYFQSIDTCLSPFSVGFILKCEEKVNVSSDQMQ